MRRRLEYEHVVLRALCAVNLMFIAKLAGISYRSLIHYNELGDKFFWIRTSDSGGRILVRDARCSAVYILHHMNKYFIDSNKVRQGS